MNEVKYIGGKTSARATPANCEYGVELTRHTEDTTVGGKRVWRMTVTVTDYHHVDPNIFLYQRRPALPQEGASVTNLFLAVCTPVDLDELPAGTPTTGEPKAMFRMADADFITKDRDRIDDLWTGLQEDVTELIRTLVGICELSDCEYFTIGDISSSSSSLP